MVTRIMVLRRTPKLSVEPLALERTFNTLIFLLEPFGFLEEPLDTQTGVIEPLVS